MGSILGGGGSKQSSSSTSGYAALPPQLQAIFNQLGMAVGQYTNPNNPGVTDRFTPLAQTADETAAFDKMRQGFAPNAQSIGSDIAMQQNPFDQYVIDGINREATGQNSILGQNLTKAGQFGSNRGMLGANDIDLSRLQQIGQFKQGGFNTAMNNALTTLPQARANDAQGLLGIGGFQRDLASGTNLAPVSALQAGTGMINPFTAGGTSTSTQSGNGTGMLGGIGSLFKAGGSIWNALPSAASVAGWSDVRLKENVVLVGEENGHKIYEFNYVPSLDIPGRYQGVLAQDVLNIEPDAVSVMEDGMMMVDYAKIGVEMREVANG